jgi:hypothetical protein
MYSLLAFDIRDPGVFAPNIFTNFGGVLNFVIPFISIGAALAFLGMMLLGAFQWITAGDSSENVAKAQKTIMFAIAGMIVVFVSYAGVKIISVIFGINGILPF